MNHEDLCLCVCEHVRVCAFEYVCVYDCTVVPQGTCLKLYMIEIPHGKTILTRPFLVALTMKMEQIYKYLK